MLAHLRVAGVALAIELVAFAILSAGSSASPNRVNPLVVGAVIAQGGGLLAADAMGLRSPMRPLDPATERTCESNVYRSPICQSATPGNVVVLAGGFLQSYLLLWLIGRLWSRGRNRGASTTSTC